MSESPETKLNDLRNKTDRQLIELIGNRLDRGLAYARLLADADARKNWVSHDEYFACAERAHREAASWLPLLSDITELERRRLHLKLTQLGAQLAQTSRQHLRVQTACS